MENVYAGDWEETSIGICNFSGFQGILDINPVRGPERAQPLSFSKIALFSEYECAHARRAPRSLGREALRGGSAGSILDDFRHAFRPTAEAASRNFNAQPGIKRTSLDLSDAPRVG